MYALEVTGTRCTWARAVGVQMTMVEMTSPTLKAASPRLPGAVQRRAAGAFQRIVDFFHQQSDAAIGLQLGHSGPKGSPSSAGSRSTSR